VDFVFFKEEGRKWKPECCSPRLRHRCCAGHCATSAQTIKIGFITSYSGLNGIWALHERGAGLSEGAPEGAAARVTSNFSSGTTPPHPDKAKQIAQELIVARQGKPARGVDLTPNAMAMGRLRPKPRCRSSS